MGLNLKTLSPHQLRALLNATSAASAGVLNLIELQRDPTYYATPDVDPDDAEAVLAEALYLVLTTFDRAEDQQLIAALNKWLEERCDGVPTTAAELMQQAEAQL